MTKEKCQDFLKNFSQLYTTSKRKEAVELMRDFFGDYEGGNIEMDNCLQEMEQLSEQWKQENTAEAYYIQAYSKAWGKNYKDRIANLKRAIELDENFVYAYVGLGNVYWDLKEYDYAKINFEKAIELDENFVAAYNGLGNVYWDLKEYDKAKCNYEKAIELDVNFMHAYNGLGNLYYYLNEYDKAKSNYEKAIKLDVNYGTAYYNRALLNGELGLYKQAIADYEMYIKLSKEPNDIYVQYAKQAIEELIKKIENKDYDAIVNLVEKIKDKLRFNNQCITHYTTFTASKFLLLNGSKLRLSEGSFLNDTSEGKQLFTYLNWQNTKQVDENEVAETFTEKPFVGSFVAEHEHNNLALWRMYGKDGQNEAKGCAITIDKVKFIDALKVELKMDKEGSTNMSNDIFYFYNVAYKNEDDSFILPFAPKSQRKFNTLMKELKEKIGAIGYGNDKEKLRTNVAELLNGIAYLFKTAEYQYEHEVRLVLKGIGFEKKFFTEVDPPKVYIDLTNILSAVSKLTLGPKVEKADEWAAHFNYKFIAQGFKDIAIVISRLPYK